MKIEDKFNYRFNPKSNRLGNYDYGKNGAYFITICCKDRQEYFGEIIEGKMVLNEYGKEVEKEIQNIPIFRKNVILDTYIVMPNHVHINLFLDNVDSDKKMFLPNISTQGNKNAENYFSKISPTKNSLGNIIKLFKGYVSRNINKKGKEPYFAWQKNYYDRIIRNDDELKRIRIYIDNNPLKWGIDKENEIGIFM